MCTATAERNFMYTQKARKKSMLHREKILCMAMSWEKNKFLLPERVHKIYTYAKLTIPTPLKSQIVDP